MQYKFDLIKKLIKFGNFGCKKNLLVKVDFSTERNAAALKISLFIRFCSEDFEGS